MLWMGEQHPDKDDMECDEQHVETIAPVTKNPIASGWRAILAIVLRLGNYCGTYRWRDQSWDEDERVGEIRCLC